MHKALCSSASTKQNEEKKTKQNIQVFPIVTVGIPHCLVVSNVDVCATGFFTVLMSLPLLCDLTCVWKYTHSDDLHGAFPLVGAITEGFPIIIPFLRFFLIHNLLGISECELKALPHRSYSQISSPEWINQRAYWCYVTMIKRMKVCWKLFFINFMATF